MEELHLYSLLLAIVHGTKASFYFNVQSFLIKLVDEFRVEEPHYNPSIYVACIHT